jgi:hypothetical protein
MIIMSRTVVFVPLRWIIAFWLIVPLAAVGGLIGINIAAVAHPALWVGPALIADVFAGGTVWLWVIIRRQRTGHHRGGPVDAMGQPLPGASRYPVLRGQLRQLFGQRQP